MQYPTIEQVKAADREQLCRWWRFLPSPGTNAICAMEAISTVNAAIDQEAAVMRMIRDRFFQTGGFTPEISKKIGWGVLEGLVAD